MMGTIKNSFYLMAVLVLFGTACKRGDDNSSVEFAKDPSFSPTTKEFEISLAGSNEVPCLFENNFMKFSVDSLLFSSNTWYIVIDGGRLLMSSNISQVLTTEGEYELDYTFNRSTQVIDTTIKFTVKYCPVEIMLSDAFSPDGDGQFDEWRAITKGVGRFSCIIKNDKGESLFITDDQNQVWNGSFQGRKMPSGTYHYVVEGAFKNGNLFEYTGSIELIR
jgi:gliding motility-associated-like protein